MNKSKSRQLLLGAGHIGAVCISFFLLPGFIDFTEDVETVFDSFETALYLRIFFSWFSIWFTLSFIVHTTLSSCFKLYLWVKKYFFLALQFLTHSSYAEQALEKIQLEQLQERSFHFVDLDDPQGGSNRSQGKGFKFPTVLPKKFIKRFKISLKRLGNLGFSNQFNLWGFKLDEKFIDRSEKSDFRRKQKERFKTKKKPRKSIMKKVAKIAKKAVKKVKPKKIKAAKAAKPAKAAKVAKLKTTKAAKAAKPAKVAKQGKKVKDLLSKHKKEGTKQFNKSKSKEVKALQKAAGKKAIKELAKKIAKMRAKQLMKAATKASEKKPVKTEKVAQVKAPVVKNTNVYKFSKSASSDSQTNKTNHKVSHSSSRSR